MTKAIAIFFAFIHVASVALSQGFNIDLGGGQPSSSFGAAGDQPGYWNAGAYGRLRGLDGARSTVYAKRWTVDGGGSGSVYNPINTGDYAKLLNDAEDVGTGYQGGLLHLTFAGLQPGAYKVVTYAVIPGGGISYAPVYIPQATENQVQIVTGPMPGNAFEYLITHSVHDVRIATGGTVELIFYRAPFAPRISVNGIQIVPVPQGESDIEGVEAAAADIGRSGVWAALADGRTVRKESLAYPLTSWRPSGITISCRSCDVQGARRGRKGGPSRAL